MRILILGVTGMLGSSLHRMFAPDPRFETWGTMRNFKALQFFAERDHARLMHGVDISDQDALVSVLNRVRPAVVINAVGVIKQLSTASDPLVALPINALFPHRLAGLCGLVGARMIHVSSDCVFSGETGMYRESSRSDATDLYGKSKFLGEVDSLSHVVTLRTSGIGHELSSRHGLLEWFLAAQTSVRGFSNAIYSGLPWIELARVIREFVFPNPELSGLFHVASSPISKLELLRLIAAAYGKHIEIVPDDSVRIDRSLDSTRFHEATGYLAASWPELVAEMHRNRPTGRNGAHV